MPHADNDKDDNWLLVAICLWMAAALAVLLSLCGCISRTEINNARAVTISVSPQTNLKVQAVPLP